MSKILVNQISNYGDNSPIEVKEGLNIPAGKPLQVEGVSGSSGQVLTSTGTSVQWTTPFDGDYNSLINKPTIPAAQVSADWTATSGVARILNKPIVPPLPSVTTAAASGGGSLSYTSLDGEFTFTPPDLSPYLTSLGDAASVTSDKITNWDTAYGWGDHAQAGYLTAYTESQTLDDVLTLGATTTQDITTTGKVYFSNNFDDLTALTAVDAGTYHGMFAHVHDEGHGYFAHAGGWTQLLDTGSSLGDLANVDLDTTAPTTGQVLTYDGANWIPGTASGGGGDVSLSDFSVTTNAAGTAALSYNNLNGTFTYTPPDLSSYLTSLGDAANVTNTSISNWDTAYGWGDHSTAGYLKPEPDGSTNLDAPLTITRASDTFTNSVAFTSAHIVSPETAVLRDAAGADLFTDMAHICGGFLPNGNFVQILHTYGGSGFRTHLVEMNATTGQRETFKYIWTTDGSFVFNTDISDGFLTCKNEEQFQDLRLDSSGNIVTAFRGGSQLGQNTWIVSIDPSTWTIVNQYQSSQSDYRCRITVGKDGYTYFEGIGTNYTFPPIYKIDMSTGTVLSKLDSIADYDWFDADSSGNIYTVTNDKIAKYTWTGATYTVAWAKTLAGISTIYNAKLTDSYVIISGSNKICSFSTTDGSINWTRDLSPANFTIPEVDADSYSDWKTSNSSYVSTITVDPENVYVKVYADDGWQPENYEDARCCLIVVLDILTGNCVDSLLLRKTIFGGYGEWYSAQHGMYWNNNKLIVPNISGVNPSTGDYYGGYGTVASYSFSYSFVENAYLNTSNISSNAGVLGPHYNSEIINTGSSVYTITTNDATVTETNNTVTPVVTISPTDLTLTSNAGLVIYDESDATLTEYLMDNEVSNYLSPSVPNTLSITSPSDKPSIIVEENIYRKEIAPAKIRTQEIVLGHEAIDEFITTITTDASGNLQGATLDEGLFTNFSNFKIGNNIVIGYCPNDDSNPSNDYYDRNSYGVQIGYQTRLTNNYNVAIGYRSGPNATYTDGGNNVFIGQNTGNRLGASNVGSKNVNVGHSAGSRSSGSDNISLGYYAAGRVNHTGSKQITIGNVSQVDPTASTGLAIGYYSGLDYQYTLGSESYWLTGDSSFNVDIPQQLTAGSLVAGGLTYPTSNGTSGDVLTSDGSGNVTWAAASGGGGANVTISDIAPTSPTAGDLWWESDKGRLKIYYNDTDSQQWVDASPPLAPATAPVAVGCITLNGTSPTWTGTSGYTVSGAQPGGAGTDYVITLTFPTAYSARTDYIVQTTYDSTNYVSGNGASIGVARGTASVVFTPRRWDENPLSLGEIMVTITNL